MVKRLRFLALFLGIALSFKSIATPKTFPNVLVSIKPLHSLVQTIMAGVAEPHLLLTGAVDPHHFSLSPSHAKLIQDADLVIWVGPILEEFLIRPLATQEKARVTLMLTDGLRLLRRKDTKECALEETCPQKALLAQDGLTGDLFAEVDPHLWLDIENVIVMVREITYHLSAVDLEHAHVYQANAEKLLKKLAAFKEEMDQKAKPLANVPFIAFHDAYGYLEYRYHFKNYAAGFVKGHKKPSLKAFSEIKRLIKEHSIKCILSDPQHPLSIEQKLAEEFKMSLVVADPLGLEIKAGPDHFFDLMRQFMDKLAACHLSSNEKSK